jgi:uncharacterized membrane protein
MSEEPQKPKRTWRWPQYLLVVSLGLNLLVAGLMAGAFFRDGPRDHIKGMREASALGLRAYIRALDRPSTEGLMQDIATRRGEFKAGRAAIEAHLKALAAALTASPYDPDAVKAVLDQQRGDIGQNVDVGHQILLARINAMSDADRAAFAERLTARRR